MADIGLQGKAKRIQGRLLPCYDVYAGGDCRQQGARLGQRLGTIAAKRIPDWMAALVDRGTVTLEAIGATVAAYDTLPASIPDDWFVDWGDDRPFNLEEVSEGECAAGGDAAAGG